MLIIGALITLGGAVAFLVLGALTLFGGLNATCLLYTSPSPRD